MTDFLNTQNEENNPNTDLFKETILTTNRVYEGGLINLDLMKVELPDKTTSSREVVRHPGAVGILALTDDGNVILVRQYRVAFERSTLEIPAGKIELGETPLECAKRELMEETGVQAGKIKQLATLMTTPGYSDELFYLFMATNLEFGEPHLDEGEFLAVEMMPAEKLINFVLDQKIEDGKTVVSAMFLDAILRRLTSINED